MTVEESDVAFINAWYLQSCQIVKQLIEGKKKEHKNKFAEVDDNDVLLMVGNDGSVMDNAVLLDSSDRKSSELSCLFYFHYFFPC